MMRDDVARIVRETIADTFDCPVDQIDDATVAEDVSGWDSLQHTILMVRIQSRLGRPIDEATAADATTVGDLIDRIARAGSPDAARGFGR